jgi:hypothetical protein
LAAVAATSLRVSSVSDVRGVITGANSTRTVSGGSRSWSSSPGPLAGSISKSLQVTGGAPTRAEAARAGRSVRTHVAVAVDGTGVAAGDDVAGAVG